MESSKPVLREPLVHELDCHLKRNVRIAQEVNSAKELHRRIIQGSVMPVIFVGEEPQDQGQSMML
jgi:hypothetical protein